jgi:DNA-binding NtrC family response regulator
MHNEAFPKGSHQALRLRIRKEPFETAQELFRRQRFAESLAIIKQALQQATDVRGGEPGPSLRDGALLVAENLQRLRRYDECREWLRLARAEQMLPQDDPEAVIVELWITWSEGHYRDVIREAERFLQRYTGQLHPLLSEFLFLRGIARSRVGEHRAARDDCETAYSLFKVLGRRERQAEACNAIGTILLQQSRYGDALRWLHESLEINRELDLTRRIGDNFLNIGIAYYKMGKYEDSRRFLTRAIETDALVSSPDLLCRAKIALGNVKRLQRDFSGARSNLMAAYTLATERRAAREECLSLEFLGDVLRDEGKPEEARRYYARGMAIAKRIAPSGDLVMELLRRDGECLELLDRPDEAVAILKKARALAVKLGDRFEEGVTLRCLATTAAKSGDLPAARTHIVKALTCLEDVKARHELAMTHLSAARVFSQTDPAAPVDAEMEALLENALKYALAADQLFQEIGIPYWLEGVGQIVSELAWRHLTKVGGKKQPAPVLASVTEWEPEAGFVAASRQIRAVLQQSDAFADFDEAVLITGETGTGKELVARRIHALSPRRERPFVAVNCAAVPATLFEREFFGHRRGAYSGADQDSPGFVAQADGGTLFLDEIGELPWELQAKLLRLLQDGSYTRLGDPQEHKANVRLLAATNADLDELVAEGRFRKDLNYRLKALEIDVPPLRERRDDILPLLKHYLTGFAGRPVAVWEYFNEESVQVMMRYSWPGNVREVIMVARRAHISKAAKGQTSVQLGTGAASIQLSGSAKVDAAEAEGMTRERILKALDDAGGNKAEAARLLGVARQTLYRWLRRYRVAV